MAEITVAPERIDQLRKLAGIGKREVAPTPRLVSDFVKRAREQLHIRTPEQIELSAEQVNDLQVMTGERDPEKALAALIKRMRASGTK